MSQSQSSALTTSPPCFPPEPPRCMESLGSLGFMPLGETRCFMIHSNVYGHWPEGFSGVYENWLLSDSACILVC